MSTQSPTQEPQGETIGALRRALARRLSAAGIEPADLEARLILADALSCDPSGLLARADERAGDEVRAGVEARLSRRLAGEPMARILGRREFWSLDFELTPDTLVPRPDTETVVEAALAALPDREAPLRILDLGTGSGAILAALLVERPAAFGIGVDLSEGAARAARDNLARVGLAGRSAVLVGRWAAALTGPFDLVVSNPPYIPTSEIPGLAREVRLHDPGLALDGGADGLDAYSAIARALPRLLRSGGIAVLELGIGQEAAVAGLLREAGLLPLGPARADLSGIARALAARKS